MADYVAITQVGTELMLVRGRSRDKHRIAVTLILLLCAHGVPGTCSLAGQPLDGQNRSAPIAECPRSMPTSTLATRSDRSSQR